MLRIQHELEQLRLSQAKLSRMADVNQVSMSRIVNGLEPAFPNRAKRMADAIGWDGDPMDLFAEVEIDDAD